MGTICQRLAQARVARGHSCRGLSLKAGLAQAVVGRIERGDVTSPDTATLVALAEALDVSLDWLVRGEGPGPDLSAEVA